MSQSAMSMSGSAVVHDRYDDLYLRRILRETRTIAMVGLSANWNRPSYFAAKYLLDRGYKVIPVNPAAAGQEILGQKVYGSLEETNSQPSQSQTSGDCLSGAPPSHGRKRRALRPEWPSWMPGTAP